MKQDYGLISFQRQCFHETLDVNDITVFTCPLTKNDSMDQAGQDDHSRTLIHIDIDCFYAQVEMVKNPSLVNVPLGIQQKNIVVTSNYLARQYGIKKCMLVTEAQKLCPELVLANGEDLHDYRQISYKITSFLQKYSPLVERLGLDENFIDVTSLITETDTEVVGNTYGISDSCDCGCEKRLKFGTQIARDIRDAIKREFKLTCCAGIAHNKLLAKLACGLHKPNQQTVVFPNSGYELVTNLGGLSNIPGIGTATMNILKSMNITTITDLQNCDKHRLKCAVGPVKSKFLCDVAYALDPSPVKPSGRPQSIGLEDSCKSLSVETEIREKLAVLLQRLMVLIDEDGRAPKTIKLTIRKFDRVTKTSHRETKQCNINPSVFVGSERAAAQAKVMASVMHLFNKMVDTGKPYHITLLGLSCTKFQEPVSANNQLTKFLRKNFEVQSITNIENNKGKEMWITVIIV